VIPHLEATDGLVLERRGRDMAVEIGEAHERLSEEMSVGDGNGRLPSDGLPRSTF
jgi:hypothetical protein